MSAAPYGKSGRRTCRAACTLSRCSGLAAFAVERFFEELDADPLQPPHVLEGRRGPGLVLDHLRKQRQPHRCDLAVVRQLGHREIEEPIEESVLFFSKPIIGETKLAQNLPRVLQVEGIDGGEVIVFDEPDFEGPHEPGRGHREVVADQNETLDIRAIALPQGPDELATGFARVVVGVEPLFELVEHDQEFTARGQQGSSSASRRLSRRGSSCQRGRRPRGAGPSAGVFPSCRAMLRRRPVVTARARAGTAGRP